MINTALPFIKRLDVDNEGKSITASPDRAKFFPKSKVQGKIMPKNRRLAIVARDPAATARRLAIMVRDSAAIARDSAITARDLAMTARGLVMAARGLAAIAKIL
ncbi:MAG: hypothetical protein PHE55_20585 [Methylococcaceae bacterium]|nr:hypothetical protein [Methylococcaceae bacterium]